MVLVVNMGVVKFKKVFILITSFLTMISSCFVTDSKGMPIQLKYFDQEYTSFLYKEYLIDDEENKKFIYRITSYHYQDTDIYNFVLRMQKFYNWNEDYKFKELKSDFRVYDTYTESYVKRLTETNMADCFQLKSVEYREIYIYYDDIYAELNEEIFQKYDFSICVGDYDGYTKNRNLKYPSDTLD